MDHIGVIVNDLAAAIEFFVDLGFELGGQMKMQGELVDRLIGLDDVRTEFAFVRTPDGSGQLELIQFNSPTYQGDTPAPPANKPGIRHLALVVEDIETVVARLRSRGTELVGELVQYEESWKLAYVRGPEGIIVELAEQLS
jgi:catechol 2,3-dioxygenase-like lactoylglutathione lyase family enzyme